MCQLLPIEHIWAFKEENLEITHEKGMIYIDFLDVILNLEVGKWIDTDPTANPMIILHAQMSKAILLELSLPLGYYTEI